MKCPEAGCGETATSVKETLRIIDGICVRGSFSKHILHQYGLLKDFIVRYRECRAGHKFKTIEVVLTSKI